MLKELRDETYKQGRKDLIRYYRGRVSYQGVTVGGGLE